MRLIIAFILGLTVNSVEAQEIEASYMFSGMGSNMGSAFPVFKISNGYFLYTKEVNSYWDESQIKPPDTLLMGKVSPDCMLGLQMVLYDLGDTSIHDTNWGIMSGGHHSISVSNPTTKVQIYLQNGWHSQAQRIVDLMNLNIPDTNLHLWLNDEKWGGEYADKRIGQLMDSLRLCPLEQVVGYLKEYRSFQFQNVGNAAYHEFAFDFVFAFYERFFLTLNGVEEGHIKDWISIAAIGLKKKVELQKNPWGEIQRLSENFAERIQDLPEIKRPFAQYFWDEMVKKTERLKKMSE